MKTCSAHNCENPVVARGLCSPHYHRARKSQTLPDRVKVVNTGPCIMPDCGNTQFCRNLCQTHYDRWLDRRDLTAPVTPKTPRGDPCAVEGCTKVGDRRGMCAMHYERLRRTGSVGPVGRLLRERGTGTDNGAGYYRINTGTKKIFVHRRNMEEVIGRPLRGDEDVHHRDGDRSNNDPANLELWSRSHPRGQRVTDKVRWALDLLKQYPAMVSGEGYRLLALESAEATEILGKPSFADFNTAEVIRRFKSPTG